MFPRAVTKSGVSIGRNTPSVNSFEKPLRHSHSHRGSIIANSDRDSVLRTSALKRSISDWSFLLATARPELSHRGKRLPESPWNVSEMFEFLSVWTYLQAGGGADGEEVGGGEEGGGRADGWWGGAPVE